MLFVCCDVLDLICFVTLDIAIIFRSEDISVAERWGNVLIAVSLNPIITLSRTLSKAKEILT